jgi:hypothetical protein
MHDGIHVERAGLPSATICTDRFTRTASAMAQMWGAPDYPTIFTEHPIENLSREQLRSRAQGLAARVVSVLTGDGR